MASVVVEEIIEAVVEEAVEESVETAVEETVEETVEQTVEESVEQAVEETVEQTVEDAVETAVEDAVENATEDSVESSVEDATQSVIKKRLVMAVKALGSIASGISTIAGFVKSLLGKTKCDLDADTESQLDKTTNVLDVLKDLVSSWAYQLKSFKQDDSLGQVDYDGTEADAAGTVFTLFTDMKNKLNAVSRIASECAENCQWKANMDEYKLNVILAAYKVQAIFLAKDNAPVMKEKNFPPQEDRHKMTDALDDSYSKEWIQVIQLEAKKNLTKAVQAQAKAASQAAVKKVIAAPMKTEVKSGMEKQVVPDVKSQAMSAAKAQVTEVMNRYNSAIHKHAAIPGYGIATLKKWMEDNVKPTAVKEATDKAKSAADSTLKLPPAQMKIMAITTGAQHKVLSEYNTQIKQAANQAADEAIKKALKNE